MFLISHLVHLAPHLVNLLVPVYIYPVFSCIPGLFLLMLVVFLLSISCVFLLNIILNIHHLHELRDYHYVTEERTITVFILLRFLFICFSPPSPWTLPSVQLLCLEKGDRCVLHHQPE